MTRAALLPVVLAAAAGLAAAATPPAPAPRSDPKAPPKAMEEHLEVPPPPFSEGIFPCSSCHEGQKTNPKRRELKDEHQKIVLKHDEQHRWCLDCQSRIVAMSFCEPRSW